MNEIIQAYQILFPYRQRATILTTMEQLEDSIRIELLDELTHPRVRKSPAEKLQIAYQRIENSELNHSEKNQLIELYKVIYNNVNTF